MTARHDRAVRSARRWTLASFLAFCVVYVLGWFFTWNWDLFENCQIFRDQRYEPEIAELSANFPFKNTCNADYDMVPTWVNPSVVGTGAVFLISLALLVVALIRRTRARSTAS